MDILYSQLSELIENISIAIPLVTRYNHVRYLLSWISILSTTSVLPDNYTSLIYATACIVCGELVLVVSKQSGEWRYFS